MSWNGRLLLVPWRHVPTWFDATADERAAFHLHVHLIPRHRGDVPGPAGGVRHVIPALTPLT
jgi:diadenosine tetraphosphate (Ap4A) HIT family hydrolase